MSQMELAASPLQSGELRPVRSFRLIRRLLRRPVAILAIAVIVVVYGAGLSAPIVAPYDFDKTDLHHTFAAPSSDHLLGTDRLGRDVLSRLMWSAQTTIIISAITTVTGGLILGLSLGMTAGYYGGRVDNVIMRIGDTLHSVPTILLLIIINATMKDRVRDFFRDVEDFTGIPGLVRSGAPEIFLLSVGLSIFSWVGIARLVRSQVLSLRHSQYVTAARSMGASGARVVFRHLLPNVTNLVVVAITVSLGTVAYSEIGLTFLGVGVQDRASFGVMISQYAGPTSIRAHPLLIIAPLAVIAPLLLAFNLLGDALTDILSPRRR